MAKTHSILKAEIVSGRVGYNCNPSEVANWPVMRSTMIMPFTVWPRKEFAKTLLDAIDVESGFLKNHHLIMRLGKNLFGGEHFTII